MPRIDYRNAAGERLPGVTTVLNVLAKPALIPWAYNQGKEGLDLYDKRDKAADAGTFAHLLIEHHLKGLPEPSRDGLEPEIVERSENCFLAYLEWEKTHKFHMIESEVSLVSEEHQFGGTIDIGAVVGDTSILDIKTSGGVYLSMKCQIAAYGRLWNEHHPNDPIKVYHILRLGAEGDFTHYYYPELDDEWQIFLHTLSIYKILKATGQKL